MVQWIRICLPLQGTQVQLLVWEDPTCLRAMKAREPQLLSPNAYRLCSTAREATAMRSLGTMTGEGPPHTTTSRSLHTGTEAQGSPQQLNKNDNKYINEALRWINLENIMLSEIRQTERDK